MFAVNIKTIVTQRSSITDMALLLGLLIQKRHAHQFVIIMPRTTNFLPELLSILFFLKKSSLNDYRL